MLLTGNYSCITKGEALSIRDAVHGDLEKSRAIYGWVDELVQKLGGDPADQVPFEKYAKAAESLLKPSSGARAVYAGAAHIERVDALVQIVAKSVGMQMAEVDEVVATVDSRLVKNQAEAS